MRNRKTTVAGLGWLFVLALVATQPIKANTPQEPFDWDLWRSIRIQHDGRPKPLDTYARELWATVAGSSKLRPESSASISQADVHDWNGFAKALMQAAESPTLSPQQRIASRLSPTLRNELAQRPSLDVAPIEEEIIELRRKLGRVGSQFREEGVDVRTTTKLLATIEEEGDDAAQKLRNDYLDKLKELDAVQAIKAHIIEGLNNLVHTGDLYDDTVWGSVQIPAWVKEWIPRRNDIATRERLNAALVALAFPDQVTLVETLPTNRGMAGLTLHRYDPVEAYVTVLLSWQGWDKELQATEIFGNQNLSYWQAQKADDWDRLPMIDARHRQIRAKVLPETEKYVSVWTVGSNREFAQWYMDIAEMTMRDPSTGKPIVERRDLPPVQQKGLDIVDRYTAFLNARMGIDYGLVASQPSDTGWATRDFVTARLGRMNDEASEVAGAQTWAALPYLMFPTDEVREALGAEAVERFRNAFLEARRALFDNDAARFNAASRIVVEQLAAWGNESNTYPLAATIDRELSYNRFAPFHQTTLLAGLATALLAVSLGFRGRLTYSFGLLFLFGSILMMVYGMYQRVAISGRAPVTNMFETIIWAAFICAVTGLGISLKYKQRVLAVTSAAIVMLATLLANMMPINFGASITPLQPVLRTNYWLTVHVLTIVASYGAFLFAWGIGNIGLGYYFSGKQDQKGVRELALFSYRAIQVGFVLLFFGTLLGGMWAAESWGRFWGWDPKEVWALIAFLGYAIILHGRRVGLFKNFGTLAGSVVAFSLVVMAWYGVNFVLGAGLHAYAFGTGGLPWVASVVGLNLLYVLAAGIAYRRQQAMTGTTEKAKEQNTPSPDAEKLVEV